MHPDFRGVDERPEATGSTLATSDVVDAVDFAGAVSWVPIDDLTRWYAYNRDERPEEDYADQVAASCGGDPTASGEAAASCAGRDEADARFGEGDPPLLATLASAAVTAVVFDDGHAVVHDPGLRWLLELDAAR